VPDLQVMFEIPADLELWIVLTYVPVVLIGARVIELLARMHMTRAQRIAESGFEYDEDTDHYHCAGGERLALHSIEPVHRLAVYHALPQQCESCHLREKCAPHGRGRRVYRSLATWAETDVGRFHRRVSLLMFTAGSLLTLTGIWRWSGSPGTGYLLLALAISSGCLAWDLWSGQRPKSPALPS